MGKSLPRTRSGDRIVRTALKLVIEPIFEVAFHPSSYGFRPGRRCRDALGEVDGLIKEGHAFVVAADIESYFDSIPRPGLDPGPADGQDRGTDQ